VYSTPIDTIHRERYVYPHTICRERCISTDTLHRERYLCSDTIHRERYKHPHTIHKKRCISTQVTRCRQIHMYVCRHIHVNTQVYAYIHEYICRAAMMGRNVVLNCVCERKIYPQITLQIKINVGGHVNVLINTYIHMHIEQKSCDATWYGVPTISRLLKIIGLFCKIDL